MENILIYKVIGTGEKQLSAEAFVASLAINGSPVLRFNSPGGSVYEGNTMIANLPKGSRGLVDGLAASMAAFMFLSCEHREMNSRARLMLHLPQVQVKGDASKMRATADELDKMRADFAEIIAKAAGITTAEAIKLYLQPGKDVWLTAKEAKAAGLIHKITGELSGEIPATAEATELHAIYAELIDNNHNKNKMDRTKIIGLLGAQASGEMTDEQIYAMVSEMVKANTDQAEEITALKAQVKDFEDAEAAARKNEITALLDSGVEKKLFTAEQRGNWEKAFNNDFENAKALYGTLQPVGNLKDVPQPGAEPTNEELKAAYAEADKNGSLESIKANEPEKFKAMFEAYTGKKYAE